ncbi:hypothetical protein SAMN05192558_107172 [Actinokineospora alba]|uniref:Uncharacterized protein n=1 Tax=Actinokineospora alba TaxID=504798 RepID=A0A1H0QW46_9PSEU|nr:hypothetical protein [Actinokineospora alba]TDP70369.1 hypothetical protein C8E96_5979 [Actinokineospora alba]SDI33148.1 hypothetical protein SAMN05421871_104171 [Actinokineospora alba]SDP21450.1 hypothetical protein SAMN05192558_107172 [Actinokineospora alba]
METELFMLCALPHSVSALNHFHVSLFVAPKISPADDRVLGDFRIFPDWAQTAKTALRIELFDQAGVIEAEPLLDPIQPQVWRAAFPADTPVKGNRVPEWDDRRWRSFSARATHDIAKALHMATIYADPTSPPAPSAHPLAGPLTELAAKYHRVKKFGSERRQVYDESLMTADLDGLIESPERLAVIERLVAAEGNWLRKIALELHRCRRFYERPESQDDYRERPVPGAVSPTLPQQQPEFHERCAMAGDHPALLRALGLVIDLKVADPDRLRRSRWLSARAAIDDDFSHGRSNEVRCQVTAEDAFVTVAGTPDWSDGALRLGDEDRFAVLELDTDGSAIKTERFLWTLPRLLASQANGDPVNAATPAHRSGGFTVARTGQALNTQDRLARQLEVQSSLAGGDPPRLLTEDVCRGLRIEVWDDTVRRWRSLHQRLTDVTVLGHGMLLDDLEEDGFIQGTSAHETPGKAKSPIHVHEAMFGWEGWSLSAGRPGKRVRNEGADEIVEDTPSAPDVSPTHPILITNEVRPGSLPRLRFGRSYAFRAWAVDLAGNSRPHELDPPPAAPADAVAAALAGTLGVEDPARDASARLGVGLRVATNAALQANRFTEETVEGQGDLGHPELEPILAGRLRERRAAVDPTRAPLLSRRALVAEAVAAAVNDPHEPFVTDVAVRSAAGLAHLISTHLTPGAPLAEAAAAALDTVTALRPYLRWDPVPSPALVPRDRYTEGESLRVLVVRSGVTQDLTTLAITVTDPAAYAAAVATAHPGLDLRYHDRSERHLAPPKTSQSQAEQHGMFDLAIGSTTPADHLKMLGWALREDGSFLDLDIADVDNPPSRVDQLNVRLEHQAGPPHADRTTLPLAKPGDPLPPGQYVVHDVDDLVLPYLPDPLARGISLVFPEAGRDRPIPFPFGTEGFTARYSGQWPVVEPFRLVLDGGGELNGAVSGRVLTLSLPPGDLQRFRLASSLDRADLDLFGPWRGLPPSVRANPDVAEAAADGWLWGLTPFEDVLLVHAVPRPLEAPRPTKILPVRGIGTTSVVLFGGLDVHGPSTDSVAAEARWVDRVDDLTLPRDEERRANGVAFTTPVQSYEDIAVLSSTDGEVTVPNLGKVRLHKASHEFGDTRHRVVTYRFRASTRFREYFHPELLKPTDGDPIDDGRSVVGPEVVVSVPSSAPPAAPVVHSVIPLFRWSDGTEPEQPMARRHGRRAGVRIYLERPWWSSGDGELLGVLLATGGSDEFGPPAPDDSGFPFVSKWGQDPAWISAPVRRRALELVTLDNLLHTSGFDDRPAPGRPVTAPVRLPLATLPDRPEVTVVGYKPRFNLDRGLWYVDVALDPGNAFWPFVRLAVCRYQPNSVDGCHLSAPVRCDYVQLPAERTTSVSRTDETHVRVVVSGPIGLRRQPGRGGIDTLAAAVDENRRVIARLQRRDPAIDTDLGWSTVAADRLTVRGAGDGEVAWVGELDAGAKLPLRRPGTASDWRIMVEEWEMLPGDPPAPADTGPVIGVFPIWERRLTYADEIPL